MANELAQENARLKEIVAAQQRQLNAARTTCLNMAEQLHDTKETNEQLNKSLRSRERDLAYLYEDKRRQFLDMARDYQHLYDEHKTLKTSLGLIPAKEEKEINERLEYFTSYFTSISGE